MINMDEWLRRIEISLGLEMFLGAILIMFVNRRYRSGKISRKTFHIQNLEVLILFLSIAALELLSVKLLILRNRFLLILLEVILVFVFLLFDRKLNGKESFTGGV